MLEGLLGSLSRERVLLYITGRKEGYARQIAEYFKTGLSPIQQQLDKMENEYILICKKVGKTKVFMFNPRYPFLKEILQLMERAILFLPENERNNLLNIRKRPRRSGKPL